MCRLRFIVVGYQGNWSIYQFAAHGFDTKRIIVFWNRIMCLSGFILNVSKTNNQRMPNEEELDNV